MIEENPDKFIEVVNRAAQKAQLRQREAQMAEMKRSQEEDMKNPKRPVLGADRRLLGSEGSKITIVEYADFQCPACRVGYESLKKFKAKYKGEVQFYFKNMPLNFHEMAMPAARYFEAIRLQDRSKALRFYEYVFENQRELKNEAFLKGAAEFSGADMKRLAKDVQSDVVEKVIEQDMGEFEKFGFTGTPVVMINGVALNGAQSLEELERVAGITKGN